MKIIRVLIVNILLVVSSCIFAVSVNLSTARDVAGFHLQIKNVAGDFSVHDVIELKNQKKQKLAYIVNLRPVGFVVVATDTDIYPIISYSFQHNFPFINDKNNTLYIMVRRDMEIRQSRKNDYSAARITENNNYWNYYNNKDVNYFQSQNFTKWPNRSNVSDGLLQNSWIQGFPYNKFCPVDPATQANSFIGSVGISIAHIINYHKYIGNVVFSPEQSYTTSNSIRIDQDSQSYQFPNFIRLNDQLALIGTLLEQGTNLGIDDLAYLNFSCGLAVKTDFDAYESNALTEAAATALTDIFKFASAKLNNTINNDFFNDLRYNIVNELPVILDIKLQEDNISRTQYQRAVVCDGYNSDQEIHLNFGWGINSQNITSAWYHFSGLNTIRADMINLGIMFIEGRRRLVSERPTEKIIIEETDFSPMINLFDDDEMADEFADSDTTDIEEEVNIVLNKDSEESLAGTTSKFVVYEVAPVPIRQIPPEYPDILKKEGISGQVWLEVEVFDNGKVGAVNVLKSLVPGAGGLDEAAVNAVKQWEFSPAKSAGKPVSCWVSFPINFSLK
ncbi:MAG: TonB family protein [Candidatus Cloacimonetes bacterium]|nr:TonB family protein [Candidatus Cloacimonadota bacterium]